MVAAIIHQEQIVSLKEPPFEDQGSDHVYGTQTVTKVVDLNLPHLEVHYRRDLPNGKPYDVYVFGTARRMKLKAKWYNKHPKRLVKFLNKNMTLDGYEVTTEMLR